MRCHFERLYKLGGLLISALCCAAAPGGDAFAQSAATQVEPSVQDPLAHVRGILERFCAECVEAGLLGAGLGLDDLARDPSFVIAKEPDASRVYQRLLDLQMGAGGNGATPKARPAPADVEAVRDWIDSLPVADGLCADRFAVSAEEIDAQAARWLEFLPEEYAADTRFVSLAHLTSVCITEKRLAESREAVRVLLHALGWRAEPAKVETLGDASALLAFRLSEVGLTPERWDRLIDAAPPLAGTAVPGDWLAAHVLSHPRGSDGAIDPAFDAPMSDRDLLRVRTLAQAWTGYVDLRRAAAEMEIDRTILAERLLAFTGDLEGTARRLLGGAISRTDWDDLKDAIEGWEPVKRQPALDPAHIDVGIWTDKPAHKIGDVVEISVKVDRACYLTLINVDGAGKAIVLFPNDLEPDNLVAPQVTVKVPGAAAGYQLRFDRAGRETLVAQCQRSGPRMAGLAPDYERQRFTILGDWRTFLRTAADREAALQTSQERRSRRGRRGEEDDGSPTAASKLDHAEAQGRAAIAVTIE